MTKAKAKEEKEETKEEAKEQEEKKPKAKKTSVKKDAEKKTSGKKRGPKPKKEEANAAEGSDGEEKEVTIDTKILDDIAKKLAKKIMKKLEKKGEKKGDKKALKKEEKGEAKKAKKAAAKKETKMTHLESFVAEAIAAKTSEDNKWVGQQSIVEYAKDYLETERPWMIPSWIRRSINSLLERGLIKRKKSSFSFSVEGSKKICPAKVPSRQKIQRPVKAAPEAPAENEKEYKVTTSGRLSRPVVISEGR